MGEFPRELQRRDAGVSVAPVDSYDRSNLSPQLNIQRWPSEPHAVLQRLWCRAIKGELHRFNYVTLIHFLCLGSSFISGRCFLLKGVLGLAGHTKAESRNNNNTAGCWPSFLKFLSRGGVACGVFFFFLIGLVLFSFWYFKSRAHTEV